MAPRYDFVVVDEVQDLTNVQLLLILRALRDPRGFLLCGDSNQIVHPNFFSWSKVKTLFWNEQGDGAPAELIRILNTNFRNSPQVTEIANRLLHIKHARFGSVDRESNYLVGSRGPSAGRVGLLADTDAVKRDLDRRTAASARFAILVLHDEQKAEVRASSAPRWSSPSTRPRAWSTRTSSSTASSAGRRSAFATSPGT